MKNYGIRPIEAKLTYPLRRRILSPSTPNLSGVAFIGDNDETTFHFGIYANDSYFPIGVVSFMLDMTESSKPSYQLRGMAIHENSQGEGVGKKLITESILMVSDEGIPVFWCNARESAIGFYQKMGWKPEGDLFLIGDHGNHIKMTYIKPYELKEEDEWRYL